MSKQTIDTQQALELRKQGFSFAQIGESLGCSQQRAHQIITTQLRLSARYCEHCGLALGPEALYMEARRRHGQAPTD